MFGTLGGLVLLLACVFGGVWVNFALQGDAPAAVVRAFCAAEVHQDYATAFAQADANSLGETGDQFVQWSRQRDRQVGTVLNCNVDGRNYFRELDPSGAAFDVTVVFSSGKTTSGPISLHKYTSVETQQLVWAIFDIDTQLHLA